MMILYIFVLFIDFTNVFNHSLDSFLCRFVWVFLFLLRYALLVGKPTICNSYMAVMKWNSWKVDEILYPGHNVLSVKNWVFCSHLQNDATGVEANFTCFFLRKKHINLKLHLFFLITHNYLWIQALHSNRGR